MKIGYLSECDTDYAKKLFEVSSYEELVTLLTEYEPIAWDALDLVKKIGSDKKGDRLANLWKDMEKERYGKFSKNKDAAIVMMPETMFKISVVSNQFTVPFGTAFIRLKEVGKIVEENGRFIFKEILAQADRELL